MTTYQVTKTFIGGALKGLTITERTTVRFEVGQTVSKPVGGSSYRIVAVRVARIALTKTGRKVDLNETREVEGGILAYTMHDKGYAVSIFIPTDR